MIDGHQAIDFMYQNYKVINIIKSIGEQFCPVSIIAFYSTTLGHPPPPFLRPFHSEQCNIHFKLPWQAIFAPKMHINDRLNKTSFKKNLTANASEWNWLDFINAILLHTNPNLDMSRSYNKCKQCKRALILCCFALCAANTFHYSL